MRRYTVIISDSAGYVHHHVSAENRKLAEKKAIERHTQNDDEDRRELRLTDPDWEAQAIFIFSGWCNPALK